MIERAKLKDKIELIKQEQAFGCVPACLAMVLGKDYWDLIASFKHDFDKKGVPITYASEYLTDLGFGVITKEIFDVHPRNALDKEMLKPFADAHIVGVFQFADTQESHAVVMTKDGEILCPSGQPAEDLLKGIYFVDKVIGIFE